MTMFFKPLSARTTANGAGNATTVDNATVVYVACTSNSLVTLSNGGNFQMPTNTTMILHKEKFETVYANTASVFFTKITYPRG